MCVCVKVKDNGLTYQILNKKATGLTSTTFNNLKQEENHMTVQSIAKLQEHMAHSQ